MNSPSCLLYFEDEASFALKLANDASLKAELIHKHLFPDSELKIRLPSQLPKHIVLLRSLNDPNEKLIELLLVVRTARQLGAEHVTLVAPYLAYMRQDTAFEPGEVVSQRVIGAFLASLFDVVITVDPHLHRISSLAEILPGVNTVVLNAAPLLGDLIAQHHVRPVLIGPDSESAQWVSLAAQRHGFDHAVCQKERFGDRNVNIKLPPNDVLGRAVVLIDDISSSGRTLSSAAQMLKAVGATSVDVAITHALFAEDALEIIGCAGVSNIWSTDCILHPTNAVSVSTLIAAELINIYQKSP